MSVEGLLLLFCNLLEPVNATLQSEIMIFHRFQFLLELKQLLVVAVYFISELLS